MPHSRLPRPIRKESLPEEGPKAWRQLYSTLDEGRAGRPVRPMSRELGSLYRLLAAGEEVPSATALAKRIRQKPYRVARMVWHLEQLGVLEERPLPEGRHELVAVWPPR